MLLLAAMATGNPIDRAVAEQAELARQKAPHVARQEALQVAGQVTGQPHPTLPDAPERIVSINMCADELALRLARPGALASITQLSRDSAGSNVASLAAAVPANHGAVEEVMAWSPDLVVAGRYTTRNTVALLKRLGARVVEFDVPTSIAGVRQQIREAAALFGNADAAARTLRDFDASLHVATPATKQPTAVVLRPASFTSSEGTLLDDILKHAGMKNLAAAGPLAGYEQLPLEFVVHARPDILIIAGDPDAPPSLSNEVLDHPALRGLRGAVMVVALPSRLWTCAGPGVADAVALLAQAAAELRASRPLAMRSAP